MLRYYRKEVLQTNVPCLLIKKMSLTRGTIHMEYKLTHTAPCNYRFEMV